MAFGPGTLSLFGGAVALGVVHGAEPGHGWPVAATYALDRPRTWVHALAASVLLGLGHLVSSIAVVVVFFLAKDFFGLAQLGWVRYVAGALLIGLGIREYRHRHAHDHGPGGGADQHGHEHGGDLGHNHDHHRGPDHDREHDNVSAEDVDTEGLWGIVGTAFVLGFAHEEEFEIIGLCLGSTHCLELMLVYAAAVLVALVALTLLLVAGFVRYGSRVDRYAESLPTLSAAVLVLLGLGFILGVV